MVIDKIILHHSLTKDNQTVNWRAIRRYHTVDRGWNDIGYHYGIEEVKGEYEILMGRMPNIPGAHTRGMNKRSLGICFVGDFDMLPPKQDQWEKGLTLVKYLLFAHGLTPSDVMGHRDYAQKSCPGTEFDLYKFRSEL